ncbi:CidA/LrgA family holin-like protein [Planococcus shenhongbingii]|uniref:CidA/LrgA family holin-like protein n=1 Tax=Planococcus shenhongbingii TaxID=3058398 RepID=A0ABT8NG98_9BACL|nr:MULTISPECIES: CidA/LrgA family holin-like protein [unclassified Planococcus (in: firmicutes)]MDN7246861.1 CidA/LrgA family holin-like protein [Planococcus sp. N017]WKA58784.1 CidA/LrgA family holin-like protein [Planococcus sp. N016]
MKFLLVFAQLVVLYGFYLFGEWLREFFNLPLPGSIIGFLLLFAVLLLKIFPLKWIDSGAHFLLAFLSLYFIPATVGVIDYADVFTGKGVWLIVIAVFSTFLTMAVSSLLSQWSSRLSGKREEH